jgi:Kef-type K+ transport system membrane component KefB
VDIHAVFTAWLLIVFLLGVKIVAKFVGVWPLTHAFCFGNREGLYTTLLMSTGLTFGTISALYGLTHGVISEDQYAILVAVVIWSALVPTVIAERWFDPGLTPTEEGSTEQPGLNLRCCLKKRRLSDRP